MDVRLCEFCQKKLPQGLRSDARYCPGPRCRVAATRKRRKERASTLLGPTQKDARVVIASIQQQRARAAWDPVSIDACCQTKAELEACDILIEHYRNKKWRLRDKLHNMHRRRTEESLMKAGQPISVAKEVTRIGLVILPDDCEVRAVLSVGDY